MNLFEIGLGGYDQVKATSLFREKPNRICSFVGLADTFILNFYLHRAVEKKKNSVILRHSSCATLLQKP